MSFLGQGWYDSGVEEAGKNRLSQDREEASRLSKQKGSSADKARSICQVVMS